MAVTDNPNPLFGLTKDVPTYAGRISQSSVYDVESQLIRGTMSFSRDKLRELDPSYTGYTHIFVLRMPLFMTQIANGNVLPGYSPNAIGEAQTHCKNPKALLEMGSTSYSGTPDLTLNTAEVNTGFSERSYPAPTFSAYDGKTFTIRCLETRGEPLRRAVEYYIHGVSDANLKANKMHGALNADGSLMEPTLPNYTFSIMVVQTDQTLLNIQDISIWNSCIITQMSRSQLDWENGSIDIVQPQDLSFNGVYMPDTNNKWVPELALKLLGGRLKVYRRCADMVQTWMSTKDWNDCTITYKSKKITPGISRVLFFFF